MEAANSANQKLVVTAFWEVNSGEESTVAELLKDFLPQAQREPGVKEFQIHQNISKPREFFFYEVFAGEAAFVEHQQTDPSRTSSSGRRSRNSPNASGRSSASSESGGRRTGDALRHAATFDRKRSTDARRSAA